MSWSKEITKSLEKRNNIIYKLYYSQGEFYPENIDIFLNKKYQNIELYYYRKNILRKNTIYFLKNIKKWFWRKKSNFQKIL